MFQSYGFQPLLGPVEPYTWWPLFNARQAAATDAASAIKDGEAAPPAEEAGEAAGADPSAVVVSGVGGGEDVKELVGSGGAVGYYLTAAKLGIFLIYAIVIAIAVDGNDKALGLVTASSSLLPCMDI